MASRTASAVLWSLPLFFLAAGASDAGACDSSSCVLVTRGQGGALAKGAFAVDLSFRYTDERARLSGSAPTEDVIRPRIDFDGQRLLPGFHREMDGSMNSLQADLAYGVTSRLTALASVPLFSRKAFEHAHAASTPAAPGATTPEDDPHGHGGPAAAEPSVPREYRTDGFGDTLLGLRYAVWGAGPRRLSAGLVVKLPTGESRLPNPYDGGLHDPTLQPGTGAMDYGLSVQYAHAAGPLQWTASGTQQFAAGNALGYRFGHETILGVGLTRTLRAVYSRSLVAASVQVKAHVRGSSSYRGEGVPATGGRMVILSPGLRLTTPGGMGFYAYLQLPVYRYVNDAQLATRSSILTGISKSF